MSLALETIVKRWQGVIRRAKQEKRKHFGVQAEDAMKFYAETDHSFMFSQAYLQNCSGLQVNGLSNPAANLAWRATLNLTSNVVQVFLPVLYHRNPVRTVTDKSCKVDANAVMQLAPLLGLQINEEENRANYLRKQLTGVLFDHYLNSTPRELNLKDHARLSITEALIKGMGVLWLENFPSSDGTKLVGLAHDSIDYFNCDPDSQLLPEAGWIMRERCEPIYQVERKFGLSPGTLSESGDGKNYELAAENYVLEEDAERPDLERQGISTDVITYYEIYSRIGLGTNLKKSSYGGEFDEFVSEALDGFGDNVYLAIPSKRSSYRYPLNLPPELMEQESTPKLLNEIKARVSWPVSAYDDRANPWPCIVLGFHPIPKRIWCQSHVTPVMGVQKAIDWIMSFLIGRIQISCRTFMVIPKNIEEDIVTKILYGGDLTLLQIEQNHPGTQQMLCDFLKHPEVNGEVWNLLMALKKEFEDGTGVTELNLAGRTPFQMRSAKEATVRQQMLSVRPDDMANIVDNWMSQGARLEAGAAAELMNLSDVARAFGEHEPQETTLPNGMPFVNGGIRTQLWKALVMSRPRTELFSELDFSIESGSARKPDQDEKISNVDELGTAMVQLYWQIYQATGNPAQINAWLTTWAKTRNIPNYQSLLFPDMQKQVAMQQMAAQQQQAQGGPQEKESNNSASTPSGPPNRMPPQMSPEVLMAMLSGQAPNGNGVGA